MLKIAKSLRVGGIALVGVAFLGLVSPLLRDLGIDFRFHVSSVGGPLVVGLCMAAAGYVLDRTRGPATDAS